MFLCFLRERGREREREREWERKKEGNRQSVEEREWKTEREREREREGGKSTFNCSVKHKRFWVFVISSRLPLFSQPLCSFFKFPRFHLWGYSAEWSRGGIKGRCRRRGGTQSGYTNPPPNKPAPSDRAENAASDSPPPPLQRRTPPAARHGARLGVQILGTFPHLDWI